MKRLTQKDEQGNMLKELNEEQCKHRLDAAAGAVSTRGVTYGIWILQHGLHGGHETIPRQIF